MTTQIIKGQTWRRKAPVVSLTYEVIEASNDIGAAAADITLRREDGYVSHITASGLLRKFELDSPTTAARPRLRAGQVWRRKATGAETVVQSTADLDANMPTPRLLVKGSRHSTPLVKNFLRDYEFVREN